MLFNIPQFLDTEDKIVGPLTAKQLAWMAGAGVVLFVLWNLLDAGAFYLSAIPVCALAGAFAFYRPYNQPLIKFVLSSIFFVFNQKTYAWKRQPEMMAIPKKMNAKVTAPEQTKKIDPKKIQEISQILDQK